MEVKPVPAVLVTLRLTREQRKTAKRLASNEGIRCEKLLERLIDDGLRSLARSIRLKDWR
jgi:hypothetical protein